MRRAIWGDSARPTMEPVYMPLYTSASDLDRSLVGTHLQRKICQLHCRNTVCKRPVQ